MGRGLSSTRGCSEAVALEKDSEGLHPTAPGGGEGSGGRLGQFCLTFLPLRSWSLGQGETSASVAAGVLLLWGCATARHWATRSQG